MNKHTKEALSDVDGSLSSKRILTFLAFACLFISFFANLFFNFEVSEHLSDNMMWIILGGLGFIGAEKFSKRFTSKFPDE